VEKKMDSLSGNKSAGMYGSEKIESSSNPTNFSPRKRRALPEEDSTPTKRSCSDSTKHELRVEAKSFLPLLLSVDRLTSSSSILEETPAIDSLILSEKNKAAQVVAQIKISKNKKMFIFNYIYDENKKTINVDRIQKLISELKKINNTEEKQNLFKIFDEILTDNKSIVSISILGSKKKPQLLLELASVFPNYAKDLFSIYLFPNNRLEIGRFMKLHAQTSLWSSNEENIQIKNFLSNVIGTNLIANDIDDLNAMSVPNRPPKLTQIVQAYPTIQLELMSHISTYLNNSKDESHSFLKTKGTELREVYAELNCVNRLNQEFLPGTEKTITAFLSKPIVKQLLILSDGQINPFMFKEDEKSNEHPDLSTDILEEIREINKLILLKKTAITEKSIRAINEKAVHLSEQINSNAIAATHTPEEALTTFIAIDLENNNAYDLINRKIHETAFLLTELLNIIKNQMKISETRTNTKNGDELTFRNQIPHDLKESISENPEVFEIYSSLSTNIDNDLEKLFNSVQNERLNLSIDQINKHTPYTDIENLLTSRSLKIKTDASKCSRNARFQLQTRKGKAQYDAYLLIKEMEQFQESQLSEQMEHAKIGPTKDSSRIDRETSTLKTILASKISREDSSQMGTCPQTFRNTFLTYTLKNLIKQ
jgi:hypothetical protein